MATIKQKKTAIKTLENLGNSNPLTKGQILAEVGYSRAITKNPDQVFETTGYKKELEELKKERKIDKESRLKKLADIFWGEDKRSVLQANKEIALMLGDYAEQTTKVISLFGAIDRLKKKESEETN